MSNNLKKELNKAPKLTVKTNPDGSKETTITSDDIKAIGEAIGTLIKSVGSLFLKK